MDQVSQIERLTSCNQAQSIQALQQVGPTQDDRKVFGVQAVDSDVASSRKY